MMKVLEPNRSIGNYPRRKQKVKKSGENPVFLKKSWAAREEPCIY